MQRAASRKKDSTLNTEGGSARGERGEPLKWGWVVRDMEGSRWRKEKVETSKGAKDRTDKGNSSVF